MKMGLPAMGKLNLANLPKREEEKKEPVPQKPSLAFGLEKMAAIQNIKDQDAKIEQPPQKIEEKKKFTVPGLSLNQVTTPQAVLIPQLNLGEVQPSSDSQLSKSSNKSQS